jgi:O-antigen ligase
VAYIGVLVYCVLLYLRPADWVKPVLNWPLDFIVLAVTLVAVMVGRLATPPGEGRPRIPPQVPLLGVWVLVIFLSNAVHGNIAQAITYSTKYAKIGIIFLIFWLALDSIRKFRQVTLTLIALSATLAVQGIYQIQNGVGWAGQPLYWGGRIDWVGLWDGANVLSLLFVSSIPLILEAIFGPWKLPAKIVGIASGALCLIGLKLAASRGAWLALAVVMLVYFGKRLGKVGLLIGLVSVLALLALAPSRLENQDERDESSTRGRIDMWAEGLEMVRYNPVLGIGKGEFLNYTGLLIAHNTFVQNMGETGLIGLFVWLSIVYTSFQALRIVLQHQEQVSPKVFSAARGLFTSLTGYLTASLFISTDFELLYVLLGLAAALLSIARRETGLELPVQFGLKSMRAVVAIELVGVIAIYVVTRSLSA